MFGDRSERPWQDMVVVVGKEYISFDFAAFMVKVILCLVH